jgi:hypothetical protein
MSPQQSYNAIYYETHKDKLKTQAKLRERKNRADARKFRAGLQSTPHSPTFISRSGNYCEAAIFLALVSLITFLLLREMTDFYAEDGGSTLAWIKAIALEGTVLAFSAITSSKFLQRVAFKFVALAICAFSIYAMASKQVGLGLSMSRADSLNLEAIASVKIRISAKTAESALMFQKGWITAGRKLERQIDQLHNELKQLQIRSENLKPATATTHLTLAAVIFRMLLMLANILAAQRLGEIFRNFKPKIGILESENRISKRSPEISRAVNKLQKPELCDGWKFQFWEWLTGERRVRA